MLTDKAVNGNQSLANRIDGDEKTFKSNRAEQRRSIWSDETWSGDFLAVESQLGFGDGPDIALSASDHHALRTGGFQRELFRQRARHDAQCSASFDEEFDFFDIARSGRSNVPLREKVPWANPSL